MALNQIRKMLLERKEFLKPVPPLVVDDDLWKRGWDEMCERCGSIPIVDINVPGDNFLYKGTPIVSKSSYPDLAINGKG